MNNIIKKLAFVIIAVIGLASCQNEDATYSGPEFVMFADSSFLMPVLNNDTVFEVTVVSSTTSSVDRNFSVDIVNSGTTAIRGYHYDFVDKSNNITIKAGENKTSVKIKSY